MTYPTIGHLVRRISHVVMNVTDLQKSTAFYESVSALRLADSYEAPEQDFRLLQLEPQGSGRGRFVANVLVDQTGGDPVALHLVQWLDPLPTGRAYESHLDKGMVKLGIAYGDPEGKREQLARAGVEPTNKVIVRNYYTVPDPDGILTSFVHLPNTYTERFFHTCLAINAPIEETVSFYRDLIGLDYWMNVSVPGPVAASQGPGTDIAHFDSHFFRGRGDHRFTLDCSKSFLDYDGQPRHEAGNHVGIARFALEVDDLDQCFATLRDACAGSSFGPVGDGPVRWEFTAPLGPRRVVLVQDPSGHVFELFEPETRELIQRRPGAASESATAD